MTETIDFDIEFSEAQNELFFPDGPFPKYTIVRKGRRGGLTKGAANAFIEYGLGEDFHFLPTGPLMFLWGDTIAANIDKYVERYFLPELKKLPKYLWRWKQQERLMTIGRATIDFRSADRPENWEGFGYHLIFLNEAGIILEDDYLYNNAVLPMLIDFPNAKIIVAGAPKGKRHKGGEHLFYTLFKKSLTDKVNYRNLHFTGYNNPFIAREEIKLIRDSMDEETEKQEVYGEFIDLSDKKFLYSFKEAKHVIPAASFKPNTHLPILISYDFNVEPMTAIVSQQINLWQSVIFDELSIKVGSVEEINELIIVKYQHWLNNLDVTGDATGRNREKVKKGNINAYRQIKDDLGITDRNLRVPSSNMALKDSRQLCNSVLTRADFYITDNCVQTIADVTSASVDGSGELVKDKENGLHFFDNYRYTIHCHYTDFISNPEKYRR
jgi:hypothetical protein